MGGSPGLVCAFPAETVAIYKLVKSGKIDEAVAIYRWFMPLLELDIHTKLVQYIKLAEAQVGIGTEYVRAPRLNIGWKRKRFYFEYNKYCFGNTSAVTDISVIEGKSYMLFKQGKIFHILLVFA